MRLAPEERPVYRKWIEPRYGLHRSHLFNVVGLQEAPMEPEDAANDLL